MACLTVSFGQKRSQMTRLQIAKTILSNQENPFSATIMQKNVQKRKANGKINYNVVDDMVQLCSSNDIFSVQETGSSTPQFYVYGMSNGLPGYVIVSTDENAHDVLAFSYDKYFRAEDMPTNIRTTLLSYVKRANEGALSTQKVSGLARRMAAPIVDSPLLGDIAFNQTEPYNLQCPIENGERCVTGCTGTAMAMEMAYYQYPNRMSTAYGNIVYSHPSLGTLTWNTSKGIFDWDNILPTYTSYCPSVYGIQTTTGSAFSFASIILHPDYEGFLAVTDLTNISEQTFNGDIALFVTDANKKIVSYGSDVYSIEGLGAWYYYPKYHVLPGVSSSLADGTYRVYLASKKKNAALWQFATCDEGEDYVELKKHGMTFTMCGQDFICGYNEKQAEAISTLCASCSYSIYANFGVYGTSADIISMGESLIKYMGYSDNMETVDDENFSTEGWHQYIQDELIAKRPVFTSGFSKTSGHAFIIDGYKYVGNVPYYHVNWGWNGSSNGWYLIDNLMPKEAGTGGTSTNYSESVSLVCSIYPDNGTKHSNRLTITGLTLSASQVTEDSQISVTTTKLTNATFRTIDEAKVSVYAVGGGKEYRLGDFMTIKDLGRGYYYKSLTKNVYIPSDIPTGNYTIELRTTNKGLSDEVKVICPVEAKLRVNNSKIQSVPVNGITLSKTSMELMAGQTAELQATITPSNATDKTITWKSSNTNVATVASDGTVTAVAAGTATITVTANDGSGVSASCSVTVTPKVFKLTYVVDGQTYSEYDVAYGTTLSAIDAPTKEGYTFSGWTGLPATMPANNVTVTGSFTVNKYMLTYVVDGQPYTFAEVAYGTALSAIDAPTKEGHTFSGWTGLPATMPANNVTVTGSFKVNKYVLAYVVDGQTYTLLEVAYGTTLSAIDDPAKEGYTFSGWTGLPATMPASNVTVTGSFTVNIYTITYMYEGQVVNVQEVAYGDVISGYTYAPEDNEYYTYGFVGWMDESGNLVSLGTMPSHNITVHALVTSSETGIFRIADNKTKSGIYTLYGAKICSEDMIKYTLPTLPKGVYIINGKKVTLK